MAESESGDIVKHMQELSIAKNMGDREGEGNAYYKLGCKNYSLSNFKQAVEYHKLYLNIAKQLGDKDGEARAYCHLGNAYQGLGNYKEALEYHKLDLNIAKELRNRHGEGQAYCNLGNAFGGLGNFKQAMEHHKLSLNIAKELENREGEGIVYCNLGCAYHGLGNFKQAVEYHKQSLNIAKELENREGEGITYCNLGITFHGLGNFKQAVECHKLSLNIAKQLGNRDAEGRGYCNLGNVYQGLGNFKQAVVFHKLGLNIAKELGDMDGEGKAYCNLGNVYHGLGNFKQAVEFHKLSLNIAKELGVKDVEGKAYGNLGNAYRSLRDIKQAEKYYKLHLNIAKELGSKDAEGDAFMELGDVFFRLRDFEQAIEYMEQGLSIFKEVGNRNGEGNSYLKLGEAYAHLGNFKEAIMYHKQSLSIAKGIGNKVLEAGVCHSLGHDYDWSGYLSEALDYYRSSVKIYDDVRALLQSEDAWKISFREETQCAYTALWRILVKTGETDEALCAAEKGRAQALMDILKERYGVHSLCSASVEPEEMISDVLNNLTTQTVFITLDKHVISFWLLQRGKEILFKQKKIEGESCKLLVEATLRDIGPGFRVKCENRSMDKLRDDPPSNREAAEERKHSTTSSLNPLSPLYDVIIGPIADQGDQLIVVPDGPFFLVPYSALTESIRIRIVPSLTALQVIASSPDDFHGRTGALLVGDPCLEEITNLVGEPFWEQLPFARREVEMIGELLKTTPLIGRDATKADVLKRLTSVALVHIAAHGRAETGEILLAPNPGWTSRIPGREYYILTMSDVQAVRLRARLVVLSCCHSGQGEIKAEGVVGIARAFLCAGARSVLVSLWVIDDEATMEFMRLFYQHLVDGKSASVALYQGMKSLRDSEQFRDLKYWAPFVLIGDDVTLEFGEKNTKAEW